MTIEEARKEMEFIKNKLLKIINNSGKYSGTYYKRMSTMNKIYYLYREFLKIYVTYTTREPKYSEKDSKHIYHNCYFYAMDFVTPDIFIDALESINKDRFFASPVGIMKNVYDEYYSEPEEVIDNLYYDLDVLNIDAYDSKLEGLPKHGGNKIALYYSSINGDNDYHFIRQNIDGTWSHKIGYYQTPIICKPKIYLKNGKRSYTHIKTLELVKPSQKK